MFSSVSVKITLVSAQECVPPWDSWFWGAIEALRSCQWVGTVKRFYTSDSEGNTRF